MHKSLLIILLNFFVLQAFAQDTTYFPTSTTDDIYCHNYYCFSYAEDHEQAEWVYYMLTDTMVYGTTIRTNDFRGDPMVISGSAQLSDYAGSGYDRGHLAPAADMKINLTAMSESFYMSNMSPQEGSFNGGRWRMLETATRNWAIEFDTVYIATGPVLTRGGKTIGNDVTVPKHYYKIIYNPDDQQIIAFVLPNKKITKSLDEFIVTVDKVESLTGVDFYPSIPDSVENVIESGVNEEYWVINTTNPVTTTVTTEKVQCKAITQSGTRCSRTAVQGSEYCWQHHR